MGLGVSPGTANVEKLALRRAAATANRRRWYSVKVNLLGLASRKVVGREARLDGVLVDHA